MLNKNTAHIVMLLGLFSVPVFGVESSGGNIEDLIDEVVNSGGNIEGLINNIVDMRGRVPSVTDMTPEAREPLKTIIVTANRDFFGPFKTEIARIWRDVIEFSKTENRVILLDAKKTLEQVASEDLNINFITKQLNAISLLLGMVIDIDRTSDPLKKIVDSIKGFNNKLADFENTYKPQDNVVKYLDELESRVLVMRNSMPYEVHREDLAYSIIKKLKDKYSDEKIPDQMVQYLLSAGKEDQVNGFLRGLSLYAQNLLKKGDKAKLLPVAKMMIDIIEPFFEENNKEKEEAYKFINRVRKGFGKVNAPFEQ